MTTLKPGDKAPAFSGKDQHGNPISLGDFPGKKVVLYFYPKDDTPGCTVEACNFRDNQKLLQDKGIVVLGVSPDNEKSHQKFIQKFDSTSAHRGYRQGDRQCVWCVGSQEVHGQDL